MKTKIFTLLLVAIALFAINSKSNAQASGDYVATTSGDYNTAGNWSISNGSGGYSGTASAAPTTSINVWIPVGISMTNTSATANLSKNLVVGGSLIVGNGTSTTPAVTVNGNLTVLSGGILSCSSSASNYVGILAIGGSLATGPCTLQIDGQLGSTSGTTSAGSSFRMYFEAGGITTVQGGGKINICQIKSGASNTRNQNIVIDMDVNLLNTFNNGRTLTLDNGNAGTATKTFTINAGRTLNFSPNSVNSVLGGQINTTTNQSTTGGNMTYEINGTLNTGTGGGIWLATTTNTGATTGLNQSITLKVGATGKLILGPKVITGVAQPSTQSIIYDFAAGSQIEFAGSTATIFSASTTSGAAQSYMNSFSNLNINNSGGLTLPAATTIQNNLTLTSGNLLLADNNLTVNGNIVDAVATKHIVTNGTGTLIRNVIAGNTVEFPVGTSALSFDPVSVTPTTESVFAVNVGSVLPATAPSNYFYNEKVWNISPVTPSSTLVALTPSEITTTATNHVIGHYVNAAYTNVAATKNGNTYSATFDTFSPFVTGATDLGTDDKIVRSNLFASVSGNQLVINGIHEGKIITIYNASGQQVKQVTATHENTIINLNAGLYFIKADSKTLKIIL